MALIRAPSFAQAAPEGHQTGRRRGAAARSVNEEALKDSEVSKLDWSRLNLDASTLADGPAAKMRASGTKTTITAPPRYR